MTVSVYGVVCWLATAELVPVLREGHYFTVGGHAFISRTWQMAVLSHSRFAGSHCAFGQMPIAYNINNVASRRDVRRHLQLSGYRLCGKAKGLDGRWTDDLC
jgi:hypothetical protein